MKGYNKKQGGELQRKVLRSLIIAGAAYACTFGGDNSVWAADYTGTDTLNTGIQALMARTTVKSRLPWMIREKTAPVFILMADIIRQRLLNG